MGSHTMITAWLAQKAAEKILWGWDESKELHPRPFGWQAQPLHLRGRQKEMPVNAQQGMAAAATGAHDGDVGKLYIFQTSLQS